MLKGTLPGFFKYDLRALDWLSDGKFIVAADMRGMIFLIDPKTLNVKD